MTVSSYNKHLCDQVGPDGLTTVSMLTNDVTINKLVYLIEPLCSNSLLGQTEACNENITKNNSLFLSRREKKTKY